MKKIAFGLLASALLLGTTQLAFASVTLTSVTLNGTTSPIQVQPGDNIDVALTATLTDGSKWKGVDWGISTNGSYDTCVNTKNAKEGTRNSSTGVFTETFTIKAPAQPGIYSSTFLADLANNCGTTVSPALTLPQSVQVGNVVAYTINAHSDVTVYGANTGAAVTYASPLVKNQSGAVVGTASCSPASGSTFPVGNSTVTCSYPNATNSYFTVTVIPPGTIVTMASQKDDSYFCDFEKCFTGPASTSQATINLGPGSAMGTAALQNVSIERDATYYKYPWILKIACFTDSAYSVPCTNWVASNGGSYLQTGTIASSTNLKIATASFASEKAYDGISPVTFNPSYFYRLIINDNAADMGAYGSQTFGLPYYAIMGITQ